MKTRRAIAPGRGRKDERAAEATAMLIVMPFLVVLIFTLIDVGFSIRTRMLVENVARDAVRNAAADGGNFNPRSADQSLPEGGWQTLALKQLKKNNGKCKISACTKPPTVSCYPNVAQRAGEMITCTVTYYPKAINRALLSSFLGLGMDAMIPEEITITSYARAETGSNPWH